MKIEPLFLVRKVPFGLDVNITYVGSIPENNKIKTSVIKKKPIVLDIQNKGFSFLFKKIMKNINDAPVNNFKGIKFFNN